MRKVRRTGQAPSFRQQLPGSLSLITRGLSLALVFFFLGLPSYRLAGTFALLGLSQLLAYPLLSRSRWTNFSVGLAAIGLTSVPIVALLTPNPLLILLGAQRFGGIHKTFLPWVGATLLGVFIGKTLYEKSERRFVPPDIPQQRPYRELIIIGQHAQLIFLLHLPVTVTWLFYKNAYAAALAVAASKRPYPFLLV